MESYVVIFCPDEQNAICLKKKDNKYIFDNKKMKKKKKNQNTLQKYCVILASEGKKHIYIYT